MSLMSTQNKYYKNYCTSEHTEVSTERDINSYLEYQRTNEQYGSSAHSFACMLASMN